MLKTITKRVEIRSTKDNRNGYLDVELRPGQAEGASEKYELAISGMLWRARIDRARIDRNEDSAGQIVDHLDGFEIIGLDFEAYANIFGKRHPTLAEIIAIWKRWHLNGMRAGCEHQRAAKWGEGDPQFVVTYNFTLKSELCDAQRKIKDDAIVQLANGGRADITEAQQVTLRMPYAHKIAVLDGEPAPAAPEGYEAGHGTDVTGFSLRNRRHVNFTKPEEHPAGLMCKPCPTCGYKFGSAWLHEDLPQSVIDFVKALP